MRLQTEGLHFFSLLFFIFFLSGCAETELASHFAKQMGDTGSRSQGKFKVGNPYEVDGRWYTPREQYAYT